MLAMADTNIEQFLPIFASVGVPVAFLVPTPTGYRKSIMDAIAPVRELLKSENIHDYEVQRQGTDAKVQIESYFVLPDGVQETAASLYRPITKHGDPRIWFSLLTHYCQPRNLLAIIVIERRLYVINLSNPSVAYSLTHAGFVYNILLKAQCEQLSISAELREKIQRIHDCGFIPSVTSGDPGVGDTLENALGIERNNRRTPDYKGIELKTTRTTRNGEARQQTRSTLFTKVPDIGMTYRQIIDAYGKIQTPRNAVNPRLQLYETCRVSRPNAYDLVLEVDANSDVLNMLYQGNVRRQFVSSWYMETLKSTLLNKHHETFWVKASSEIRAGREFFRYDKILHTKNPNVTLIAPLLEMDKITVDLAAHYNPDGSWRDHGMLFKMLPNDLPLLLGQPVEYELI